MDRSEILFTAHVTMMDGCIISGPVTTTNHREFLFRNTSSGLDYYMSVEKTDGVWGRKFGPSIEYPESQIVELGQQIDRFLSR